MASESAFCLVSTRVCRLPWRFFISHALSFSSAEAKWLSASISSLLDRSDSTSEAMRCGGGKRKGTRGGEGVEGERKEGRKKEGRKKEGGREEAREEEREKERERRGVRRQKREVKREPERKGGGKEEERRRKGGGVKERKGERERQA